ncbi:MAG TPA: FtsX-like permease family protein [Planctomycetaceae bacterium]|nr:FtsX-like permease family protein [Planctomycetaceae bacterium]
MSRLRLADLLKLSTGSLSQHKGRTMMTLLGVILGAFLLVVSLSVGQGMKIAVKRTLSFKGELKIINVYPDWSADIDDIPPEELEVEGDWDEATRARLREKLVLQWPANHGGYRPRKSLTEDVLQEIEAWEQVARVTPEIVAQSKILLDEKNEYTQLVGRWCDNSFLPPLVVEGDPMRDDAGREILIHEFLAYRLGYRTRAKMNSLIGRTVRLEFSSYLSRGVIDLLNARQAQNEDEKLQPAEQEQMEQALEQLSSYVDRLPLTEAQKEILKTTLQPSVAAPEEQPDAYHFVEDYTIAGIFRSPTKEELERRRDEYQLSAAELILPMRSARELMNRIPDERKVGYRDVRVIADDELNVRELSKRLENRGYQVHSRIDFIEIVQKHVAVITYVMATLAIVALFVAALGTSNVMAMSVLERTREIGIMKAVGAREGTIRTIFLLEGSLIGFTGGMIGVLLGWLASFPGNSIARWVMAQRGFEENIEGTLFAYPLWLVIGVPGIAAIMTMLAAYVPARRASRVDPIEALRHD